MEDNSDDEYLSLQGISRSGVSCNVTVLRNGEEALEHLLRADHPAPTLIVLDYQLPRLSGFEILTRLRSNDKTRFTPVVIFSGYDAETALAECYRGGANSCVAKPVDPNEYIDRLAGIASYWLRVNQQFGQISATCGV